MQCAFSSSFLPYLLSPLVTVFGSGPVRAEAAVNIKKDPRHHHESASDLPGLIPKAHTVFPRLTSCIPSPLQLYCWICCKGAGPHLLQVQLPSLVPAPLTPGWSPPAKSRELAGVCFHPAAPPLPPGATVTCSNSLRECSFSNPVS